MRQRAIEANIDTFIIPAVKAKRWPRLLQLCHTTPNCYPALGLHPLFLAHHHSTDIPQLEQQLASHRSILAIGEVGLDLYSPASDLNRQRQLLQQQIAIATQAQLPLILHSRNANDQLYSLLRRQKFTFGGTVHAFSGSLQQAEKFIELGFLLGFGGTITFERAQRLRRIAATLALDHLVLESDAPDMAPARYHQQRNEPAYLIEAAKVIATLRELSLEELAQITTSNLKRHFALK